MRKIEFRGKTAKEYAYLKEGTMVEGNLVLGDGKAYIVGEVGDIDDTWLEFGIVGPLEVIKETVGQFTGLLDKNDEKIFEGDILKCSIYGNEDVILACEWRNEIPTGFNFINQKKPRTMYFQIEKDFEIIGNIHKKELEKWK